MKAAATHIRTTTSLLASFGFFILSAIAQPLHAASFIAQLLSNFYGEDINNSGMLGGYTGISGNIHAASYSNGQVFDYTAMLGSPTTSHVYAVNDVGAVAGTAGGNFYISGNTVTWLNSFGGTIGSPPRGLNNLGTVVGNSWFPNNAYTHAFSWNGGALTDLGALGGTTSVANGINDAGTIVGYAYLVNNSSRHAFRYSDGEMHDLGTLGGRTSIAEAINQSGFIVGSSTLSGDTITHAFIADSSGGLIDFTPESWTSAARDINDAGVVVGTAQNRAFIYSDGFLSDLSYQTELPDSVRLVTATDINNAGQILARGSDNNYYLLNQTGPIQQIPIPEPSAYACLLGALVIGFTLYLRKRFNPA